MKENGLGHAETSRGYLCVTIDTEEEGLWSGHYSNSVTVENITGIPRFQRLCDHYGVRPTYLITTPVADSEIGVKTLRPILDAQRCEIGSHVHPWNSPPLSSGDSGAQDSYLCNLAEEVQREKIAGLTDLIERRFGSRPISFRAGRYGMGIEGIRILRELGYRVDSSVIPYTTYASQHGPDFSSATCDPYFPGDVAMVGRGDDPSLLEVPVTVGFTHQHFRAANAFRSLAMHTPLRQLKAVGVLDRTGIASKVKLSPEQATFEQMKQLAKALVRRGTRVLVLMFHSSSLLPGCSPYVRGEEDLVEFLLRLEQFFRFCANELHFTPMPLGECYQHRDWLTRP